MIGTSRPSRTARSASKRRSASTKKGAPIAARSSHAFKASSGPIPAGSPMVMASGLSEDAVTRRRAGSRARRSRSRRDGGRRRRLADAPDWGADLAQGPERDLQEHGLIANLRG